MALPPPAAKPRAYCCKFNKGPAFPGAIPSLATDISPAMTASQVSKSWPTASKAWLIASKTWLIASKTWLIASKSWLIASKTWLTAGKSRLTASKCGLIVGKPAADLLPAAERVHGAVSIAQFSQSIACCPGGIATQASDWLAQGLAQGLAQWLAQGLDHSVVQPVS